MKKLSLLIILTCFWGLVKAQTTLYDTFKNPPSEAKPRTFWHWVHGAVSKEGVKADLIAMKEIGLKLSDI